MIQCLDLLVMGFRNGKPVQEEFDARLVVAEKTVGSHIRGTGAQLSFSCVGRYATPLRGCKGALDVHAIPESYTPVSQAT